MRIELTTDEVRELFKSAPPVTESVELAIRSVDPIDIYHAICSAQGNGHTADWTKETQSVQNHYERVAYQLNKRLQAA